MAFIITKKSIYDGQERLLYYFVESYRQGNKTKRKTIFKLGQCTNLYDYYEVMLKREEWLLSITTKYEEKLNLLVEKGKQYPNITFIRIEIKRYEQLLDNFKSKLQKCQQIKANLESYM